MKKINPEYRFARIFIRLSRLLGIAALAIGILTAGFHLYVNLTSAAGAAYQPSANLDQLLGDLEREVERTKGILQERRILGANLPDQSAFPPLSKGNKSVADFEQNETHLTSYQAGRDQLKSETIAEFERLIEKFQNELRSHAQNVAGPKSKIEPADEHQKPASQTVYEKQQISEEEHLFVDLSNSEHEKRHTDLEDVRAYLVKRLEPQIEKTRNKTMLQDALFHLAALKRLIPVIPGTVKSIPVAINELPSSSEPKLVTRDELRAEKVARDLEKAKIYVRSAVLESWKLDEILDAAWREASNEKEQCRSAALKVRTTIVTGAGQAAAALLGGVVVAFLILVISDFLQTQLDIATNTSVMAGSRL